MTIVNFTALGILLSDLSQVFWLESNVILQWELTGANSSVYDFLAEIDQALPNSQCYYYLTNLTYICYRKVYRWVLEKTTLCSY